MSDDDKKHEATLKELNELKETAKSLEASVKSLEDKNRELIAEKGKAKNEAQKAIDEAARKNGDVEALEKSWQAKLDTAIKERDEKLTAQETTINKMTAGAAAKTLAADIALPGSSDVLMPHIERRLKTEMTDGTPIVRVLDAEGKPSAMSVDDLKKEISEDKAFAPLIVGSRADGGGPPGDKKTPTGKTVKRGEWDGWDSKQRMDFVKEGGKVVN